MPFFSDNLRDSPPKMVGKSRLVRLLMKGLILIARRGIGLVRFMVVLCWMVGVSALKGSVGVGLMEPLLIGIVVEGLAFVGLI